MSQVNGRKCRRSSLLSLTCDGKRQSVHSSVAGRPLICGPATVQILTCDGLLSPVVNTFVAVKFHI